MIQVALGLLIRNGQASLAKSHFHSGMLMAVVTLVYVGLSLTTILSKPRLFNCQSLTNSPIDDHPLRLRREVPELARPPAVIPR